MLLLLSFSSMGTNYKNGWLLLALGLINAGTDSDKRQDANEICISHIYKFIIHCKGLKND